MARECSQAWASVFCVAVEPVPVDPSSVSESVPSVVSVDPEELPSVAVDPVYVSNVDVPVTNNSSVSEPAASETVSFKDDALSSASASSGSNSDVLGSNGAELFRKSLMTPREDIEQDILVRATENLAEAISKTSRNFF